MTSEAAKLILGDKKASEMDAREALRKLDAEVRALSGQILGSPEYVLGLLLLSELRRLNAKKPAK